MSERPSYDPLTESKKLGNPAYYQDEQYQRHGAWVDGGEKQSKDEFIQANADLAAYLESRPYQNEAGEIIDPSTEADGIPEQEDAFNNLSLSDLAHMVADARKAGDANVQAYAEKAFNDKFDAYSEKYGWADDKADKNGRTTIDARRERYGKIMYGTDEQASESTEKTTGRHADHSDTAPQSDDGGASDTEARGRHAYREADEPQVDARAEAAEGMRQALEDIRNFNRDLDEQRNADFPEAGVPTVETTTVEEPAVATTGRHNLPEGWFAGLPDNIRDAVRNSNTHEQTISPNVEGGPVDRVPTDLFAERPDSLRGEAPVTAEEPAAAEAQPAATNGAEGGEQPADGATENDTDTAEKQDNTEEKPGLLDRAKKRFRKWSDRIRAKREQRKAYKSYKENIAASEGSAEQADDEAEQKEKKSKKGLVIGALGAVALVGITYAAVKYGGDIPWNSGPGKLGNIKPL